MIEEGAFVDANQNPFKGMVAGDWSFVIAKEVDSEAPSLIYEKNQLDLLEKGFAPVAVKVTSKDRLSTPVVTLFHRTISSTDFVVASGGTPDANGIYTIPVPNSFADAMGFEYYLEARDPSNNVTRVPAAANTYYVSRIKMTEQANLPSITFVTDGTKSGWKIISIPYELATNQLQTIFASLKASSKTTWRLLTYSTSTVGGVEKPEWLAFPTLTTFERGRGYFVNSLLTNEDIKTVNLAGASAPNYTRSNLFKMSFKKGWNQVGNPYLFNLNWNDIISYNGAVSTLGKLNIYSAGAYVEANQLAALEGGFVFSQADVASVEFSFPGQSKGSRTADYVFGDLNSGNWKVDLTLKQGDMVSTAGGVGMHEVALDTYDELDGFNPPRFIDFLETNFSHPEHFYKYFARDIIRSKADHTWEFDVDSNLPGMATFTWDNSQFGSGQRELYLYDIEKQVPVNMDRESSYSFDPASSKKFRIYYGNEVLTKIRAERTLLGSAYPNPAAVTTTIPFSLPEKSGTFAVRLEVFDIVGKKVATLVHGDLRPGFYKVDWQVDSGTASDGIYIYRLTVDGVSGGDLLTGKVLIKR